MNPYITKHHFNEKHSVGIMPCGGDHFIRAITRLIDQYQGKSLSEFVDQYSDVVYYQLKQGGVISPFFGGSTTDWYMSNTINLIKSGDDIAAYVVPMYGKTEYENKRSQSHAVARTHTGEYRKFNMDSDKEFVDISHLVELMFSHFKEDNFHYPYLKPFDGLFEESRKLAEALVDTIRDTVEWHHKVFGEQDDSCLEKFKKDFDETKAKYLRPKSGMGSESLTDAQWLLVYDEECRFGGVPRLMRYIDQKMTPLEDDAIWVNADAAVEYLEQ